MLLLRFIFSYIHFRKTNLHIFNISIVLKWILFNNIPFFFFVCFYYSSILIKYWCVLSVWLTTIVIGVSLQNLEDDSELIYNLRKFNKHPWKVNIPTFRKTKYFIFSNQYTSHIHVKSWKSCEYKQYSLYEDNGNATPSVCHFNHNKKNAAAVTEYFYPYIYFVTIVVVLSLPLFFLFFFHSF